VTAARQRQLARLEGTGVYANAHMSSRHLRRCCRLQPAATAALDRAYERLHLSARACDRVLKMAQTIADLAGSGEVNAIHVQEALSYRSAAADVW
jgi:magnesium chelatase family protein